MIEIKLTKNQIMKIDDENYYIAKSNNWHASEIKKTKKYYAMAWVTINNVRKKVTFHQLIMNFPNKIIDHIDGDSLNNQKTNLRLCSNSENLCNTGPSKRNKLNIKNIHFDKTRNKYAVTIAKNKKKVFRGRFKTLEEAIEKRDFYLKKYHGEFARTEKGRIL